MRSAIEFYIYTIFVLSTYMFVFGYGLGIIKYTYELIQDSFYTRIDDKFIIFDKPALKSLIGYIFLGPYSEYLSSVEAFKEDRYVDIAINKKNKFTYMGMSLMVFLGFSIIILPKMGYGNEVLGSAFENDKYISYHYATLVELDEEYKPTSLEIFAIAEVKKTKDNRWINNVHVDGYGTVHAYYTEALEVFEAPVQITDIDEKHYEVSVLESKPELKKSKDINTKAVGVTFDNEDINRQDVLKQMKSGDKTITLIRDKENVHDENAVIIYSNYGMVGFIDADFAPLVATIFDLGGIVQANVTEITGGKDGKNYGCNIRITVLQIVEKENYISEYYDGRRD